MASGDIDDKLGPEGRLAELRSLHQDLDAYLTEAPLGVGLARTRVPFSAGISKDGRTVFLDHDLDTNLEGVDVTPALVAHETTEWALRAFLGIGEDYNSDPEGHRLANRAEFEVVWTLLKPNGDAEHPIQSPEDAWAVYDDFIDPQVRKIERLPIEGVDPRLDLYPYQGTDLYRRITDALSSSNLGAPPQDVQ